MGARYSFYLARIDYTLETRTGDWGTDSRVDLEVLRLSGDTWSVISSRWVEGGNSGRLDAGKRESFFRAFEQDLVLGASDNPMDYRKMVRFRFRIHGHDMWSPSDILVTTTIKRHDVLMPSMGPVVETWDYNPKNWVLSTDAAEGYTTLTLSIDV